MNDRGNPKPDAVDLEGFERFRKLQRLSNHWARPGRRSYYWYLTFDDGASDLRALTAACQKTIAFPYYDLTPLDDLHLTLDRVAFEGDVDESQLRAIEGAAARACEIVAPFDITVGALGGTRGAIGFSATPASPIRELRDVLRRATLSVYSDTPTRSSEFHGHVTIAYCNSDDAPADEIIAAVESLQAQPPVTVKITAGTLVLLERGERLYKWKPISRIPLSG